MLHYISNIFVPVCPVRQAGPPSAKITDRLFVTEEEKAVDKVIGLIECIAHTFKLEPMSATSTRKGHGIHQEPYRWPNLSRPSRCATHFKQSCITFRPYLVGSMLLTYGESEDAQLTASGAQEV